MGPTGGLLAQPPQVKGAAHCLTYEEARKDLADISVSEGMLPQGRNLLYRSCPRVGLLLQA